MTIAPLSEPQIADLMRRFPLWRRESGPDRLSRCLKFRDFKEAFAFMTQIALWAEKLDHHPEWFNVYNRLDITLTTHDCAGLSARDSAMIEAIEDLLAK
jgi:4a-hydroxytetrahydrobiopterin dehydratase